ncbi:LacI family DNA-binding transcriptional regulator [Thalassobacterium sedimentorum]|nr:LacI family DNA-binding transcriptional regulator [Coraliomargarita sp. SDUM461004]
MSTIGEKAGVSKNTVSLALRNDPQIPEATRQRIKQIADELGYQRNPTVAHLMAELRSGNSTGPKASLALLNANQDPQAFTRHPTIPTYVQGCQRRARQMGYSLDHFWLHDPDLDGRRLNQILRARAIRGVVVVGLMRSNRLPEAFAETWEQYPCVVTGVRTRKPALSFACTDHHIITLRAFENVLARGYRRPGLVLDRTIDQLVEGRFTAGYQIGQSSLPSQQRLTPFYQVAEAEAQPQLFQQWLEHEKPDVIFTLYNKVHDWVEALGLKVPQDIGLLQLEHRAAAPEWAGMNQHNDVCGEAAIDMVISMIHSGESGVPPYPRATLISGSWVDGKTVRSLVINR